MLIIARADFQAIIDHCMKGLPNEACGILAGKSGNVAKVYPMENVKPGPAYYEMDAAEQFRVMKDIRQTGIDMIGIFHSHPANPAYPSGIDVEKAYWPGTLHPNYPEAVYLIISLMDRSSPAIKGYSIIEGKIASVPVSILSEEK
jgi:proteasome lid subunit RPN8/RPN11